MHKAYQPFKPTANKYLQKKWDQEHYDEHRKKLVNKYKPILQLLMCERRLILQHYQELQRLQMNGLNLVREAKAIVDTKGIQTPSHIQLKLKKAQIQEERQAIIDRDNRLLVSKLAEIQLSKGLTDHRNVYSVRSLNYERRRAELLQVTDENQTIYNRITAQESEYRRELWEEDWARTEQRRDCITRYPRGDADKQKEKKRVKFSGGASVRTLSSSSGKDDDENIDEELEHE